MSIHPAMHLPEPTFAFTIPSLHDDLPLDCRVYHPPCPQRPAAELSYPRKGAVIAHPYAPLGGSYNDPVVHIVGSEILRRGFVVVAFNFRGAGTSKGRTSWMGKGELSDYLSVVGFLIRYLHELDVIDGEKRPTTPPQGEDGLLSPTAPEFEGRSTTKMMQRVPLTLLLGGYSYGSLITMRLPSITTILDRFNTPQTGSATLEILLRASKLASQWAKNVEEESRGRGAAASAKAHSRSASGSMVVGGDESDNSPRKAHRHGGKRSSFDSLRMKKRVAVRESKSRWMGGREDLDPARLGLAGSLDASSIREAYLLVSPLLPPVSHLTTFFSGVSFSSSNVATTEDEAKLHTRPTLAIFGDDDAFTSAKKLRRWAESLHQKGPATFTHLEVHAAGHFWIDPDAARELKRQVGEWVEALGGP